MVLPARFLLFCAVLALPAAASADEPRLSPLKQPSVAAFGQVNPACREWSDGCQVCQRDAKGAAQCSTPGIACTPGPVACKATATK